MVHTFRFSVAGMIACFANLTSNTGFFAEEIKGSIFPTTAASQYMDSAAELTLEKGHKVLELSSGEATSLFFTRKTLM